MKRHYCYICDDEELTSENMSEEHIIQNCIGGHLRSSYLVCKEKNIEFNQRFDERLRDALTFFRSHVKFKIDRGDRGHEIRVEGKDEEGFPYCIGRDRQAKLKGFNPAIGFDEEKNIFKFPRFREDSIGWYQKQKGYTDEQIADIKKSGEIIEGGEKDIYFTKEYFKMFSNLDLFRAVAKIAVNFYINNGYSKSEIPDAINFLKGSDMSDLKIGYYFPKEKLQYQHDDEVSHILYLRGNKDQGILYCYIELFNCHCFIVNLSMDYSGENLEERYVWDLQNSEELQKEIKLDLFRYELKNRNYHFFNSKYEDFHERMRRLNRILNLGLIEGEVTLPIKDVI